MTSHKSNDSTKRWFSDLRKVTRNLNVCLDDVIALCNAAPQDTGGNWLCDLLLCRMDLAGALSHADSILISTGMIHALHKLEQDQLLDELH
jgi:hypothetical protein